jgi:hypothetical protein
MWSVCHADHLLGVAVRVGGVDAVDAGVDRLVDDPGRVPGVVAHGRREHQRAEVHRDGRHQTRARLGAALGRPGVRRTARLLPERLGPTLSALLDAAAAEGAIRGDIGAEDLLYAVAQLYQPVPGRGPEHNRRIVGVLVDGLRWGDEQRRP